MKKYIKNKLYNTDTAKEIGSCTNGYGDFNHCAETLYRKLQGEYFLHGSGGPMSKYAKQTGNNSWSGAEEIIPLSYAAARQWAEENLPAEEYDAEFGAITDDDSKIIISISISKGTAERLKRMASEAGTSISAIIENEYKQ